VVSKSIMAYKGSNKSGSGMLTKLGPALVAYRAQKKPTGKGGLFCGS
jgi:hypothetical protein